MFVWLCVCMNVGVCACVCLHAIMCSCASIPQFLLSSEKDNGSRELELHMSVGFLVWYTGTEIRIPLLSVVQYALFTAEPAL